MMFRRNADESFQFHSTHSAVEALFMFRMLSCSLMKSYQNVFHVRRRWKCESKIHDGDKWWDRNGEWSKRISHSRRIRWSRNSIMVRGKFSELKLRHRTKNDLRWVGWIINEDHKLNGQFLYLPMLATICDSKIFPSGTRMHYDYFLLRLKQVMQAQESVWQKRLRDEWNSWLKERERLESH